MKIGQIAKLYIKRRLIYKYLYYLSSILEMNKKPIYLLPTNTRYSRGKISRKQICEGDLVLHDMAIDILL